MGRDARQSWECDLWERRRARGCDGAVGRSVASWGAREGIAGADARRAKSLRRLGLGAIGREGRSVSSSSLSPGARRVARAAADFPRAARGVVETPRCRLSRTNTSCAHETVVLADSEAFRDARSARSVASRSSLTRARSRRAFALSPARSTICAAGACFLRRAARGRFVRMARCERAAEVEADEEEVVLEEEDRSIKSVGLVSREASLTFKAGHSTTLSLSMAHSSAANRVRSSGTVSTKRRVARSASVKARARRKRRRLVWNAMARACDLLRATVAERWCKRCVKWGAGGGTDATCEFSKGWLRELRGGGGGQAVLVHSVGWWRDGAVGIGVSKTWGLRRAYAEWRATRVTRESDRSSSSCGMMDTGELLARSGDGGASARVVGWLRDFGRVHGVRVRELCLRVRDDEVTWWILLGILVEDGLSEV